MLKRSLLAALALVAAGAFAQTAEVMDRFLAEEAISFAQASRIVLGAAGLASQDSSDDECFATARSQGWIPSGADPARAIRLDEFSRLAMAAFAIRGGFLYRFFPGPRYAFREFSYKKYIQGRSDPAQKVSGVRAVLIVGRILDAKGESL